MRYHAFCDPSGGSSDSMTLAIARASIIGKCVVLAGVWERRAPFNPDEVTEEFASILRGYRVATVVGDRYSGEWVRARFREFGITYTPSERTRSAIYSEFLALVNCGRARISANARLRSQLVGLERRTARSGKDAIDHAPGAHDDLANAVAGALVLAASQSRTEREPMFEALLVPRRGPDCAPHYTWESDDEARFRWHNIR